MKPLLFILFLSPFILFSQKIDFDLDDKFAIYPYESEESGFVKHDYNGASYRGQPFTGRTTEITENCHLGMDYKIGVMLLPDGVSDDVGVAFVAYWYSDRFFTVGIPKVNECLYVKCFVNGSHKYSIKYLDNGYKVVTELYNFSSNNRKRKWKNKSVYYPNNKIAYYQEFYEPDDYDPFIDNQTEKIQFYYTTGVLFSEFSFERSECDDSQFFCSQDLYDNCYKQEYFDSKGEWLQTIWLENQIIKSNIKREGSVFGEKIMDQSAALGLIYNYSDIDIYTPEDFIKEFLADLTSNGINIPEQKIDVSFDLANNSESEKRKFILALSYARGIDDLIRIEIDPENWKNSSLVKKMYILYHELGHDVLDLKHGQGGKMMFNFADSDYSWMDFFIDKQKMFDYYKNH